MNVEIGAEAAQFPEKEYINGIAVAVRSVPLTLTYYLYVTKMNNRLLYMHISVQNIYKNI